MEFLLRYSSALGTDNLGVTVKISSHLKSEGAKHRLIFISRDKNISPSLKVRTFLAFAFLYSSYFFEGLDGWGGEGCFVALASCLLFFFSFCFFFVLAIFELLGRNRNCFKLSSSLLSAPSLTSYQTILGTAPTRGDHQKRYSP